MVQAKRKGKSEPLVRGGGRRAWGARGDAARGRPGRLPRAAHRGRGRARGGQQDDRVPAMADQAGAGPRRAAVDRQRRLRGRRRRLAARGHAGHRPADRRARGADRVPGLFRLFVVEGDDPELAAIVRSLRASFEAVPRGSSRRRRSAARSRRASTRGCCSTCSAGPSTAACSSTAYLSTTRGCSAWSICCCIGALARDRRARGRLSGLSAHVPEDMAFGTGAIGHVPADMLAEVSLDRRVMSRGTSAGASPGRPPGGVAQGEDLEAVVGDEDGVLDLGAPLEVLGDGGPAVRPGCRSGGCRC